MGVARSALKHLNATAGPRLAQAVPTMQPCSSFPRNTGLVNPTSGLKCIIGCRNGCVLVLTLCDYQRTACDAHSCCLHCQHY